jgi:adenylate kinase
MIMEIDWMQEKVVKCGTFAEECAKRQADRDFREDMRKCRLREQDRSYETLMSIAGQTGQGGKVK